MNILYLTNGFPYPLTSGYLRHYFFIKEISRRHQVTLLSKVGPSFTEEHMKALAPFTECIQTFSSTTKLQTGKIGRKMLSQMRLLMGGYQSDEAVRQMGVAVKQLNQKGYFDLIVFSGKQTYPAVKDLEGLPMVVDMCDATSIRIKSRMRYASRARLPFLLLEYQQVLGIEQKLIRNAAHLLFATCRDRDALMKNSQRQATIIPNGVDLEFWQRTTPKRGPNKIVFTGGMDYSPNIDAALFLIEQIFPRVQRSVPDAKLFIVGRDPTPPVVEAGKREGVTVTGYVEDVRPFLEQATVFAAPLRFGAGIQNKVLEAMAMGVPVVASPLAAEGLKTEDGEFPPLLVAQSPEQFSAAIITKLSEWDDDPNQDANARRFIERNFVWKRSGEKLEQVVSRVSQRLVG